MRFLLVVESRDIANFEELYKQARLVASVSEEGWHLEKPLLTGKLETDQRMIHILKLKLTVRTSVDSRDDNPVEV